MLRSAAFHRVTFLLLPRRRTDILDHLCQKIRKIYRFHPCKVRVQRTKIFDFLTQVANYVRRLMARIVRAKKVAETDRAILLTVRSIRLLLPFPLLSTRRTRIVSYIFRQSRSITHILI